jgi:hypothetical protein
MPNSMPIFCPKKLTFLDDSRYDRFSHASRTYSVSTRGDFQNDTWTEWKKPDLGAYTFYVEKRNGEIKSKRRTPQHLNPVPCSEIPK